MEITLALPFINFSASHGVGNYFLFMSFALTWIVIAFAFQGIGGLLSKIFFVFS
ncbi:MAG: hypothetical protein ABEJ36_00760 [Candidatus Nanosalina sp.]